MVTRTITTFTLKAAPDGSWSIPEEILEDLGVKPGDTVVADRTRSGQVILRHEQHEDLSEHDPVARTSGVFHEYAKNFPTDEMSMQEILDAWDETIGDAVVADYEASIDRDDDE
jgi:bifunctional DNA-binding transcriptional regulator/antitoxin component of YhaV-PrlF toxin-antitoxin module